MRIDITLISAVAFAPIFANAAILMTGSESDGGQLERSVLREIKDSSADYHLLKRGNDQDVNFLENELEQLTNEMMSLIGPCLFTFNTFNANAVDYASKLLDLDFAIKAVSPPNASLLKKLEFTKRVSREMTEAVLLEKIFKKAQVKEYESLLGMIQTNLGILSFFDSSGELNTSLPLWYLRGFGNQGSKSEYRKWIRAFKNSAESSKSALNEDSPNVVRFFIEDQTRIVSQKLDELSCLV